MKQKRLLLLLALLMTAATGAWAQGAKHSITATYSEQTHLLEQPLPYETTVGVLYETVTGESFSDLLSRMSAFKKPLSEISSGNPSVVSIGELNGASTPVTVKADGKATVILNFSGFAQGIYVNVVPPPSTSPWPTARRMPTSGRRPWARTLTPRRCPWENSARATP